MLKQPKLLSPLLIVAMIGVVLAVVTTSASSKSARLTRGHLANTKYAVSSRLTEMFVVLHRRSASRHGAAVAATRALPARVAQTMTLTHPNLDPSAAVFAGGTYPRAPARLR